MKKLAILAVVATAMLVASCGNKNGEEPTFNEETMAEDSLAYRYGILQGDGFKQYVMQMGQPLQVNCKIDSAYIDEFIKGVKEGAVDSLSAKEEAYAKGLLVGQLLTMMSKDLHNFVYEDDSLNQQKINLNNIVAGFIESIEGDPNEAPEAHQIRIEAINTAFQNQTKEITAKKMEKKYGEYKKENEAYLKKNAKAEGVTVLPSGVQYKVLVEGTGALPTDSSELKINYEGKLIDGSTFDSSYERNQPLTVSMANPSVIPGWVEVLKLMPAGSKWEVTIPQELAYKEMERGPIKPFSTLIFTIEVLK
jgi:FKBP-type peptidyl-prolyl cis-trans isomerase FklB